MKVEVTLYQGSQTLKEIVVVSKIEDAKKTALARNPTAKVIAQNPII